jgi:hypothetical protein
MLLEGDERGSEPHRRTSHTKNDPQRKSNGILGPPVNHPRPEEKKGFEDDFGGGKNVGSPREMTMIDVVGVEVVVVVDIWDGGEDGRHKSPGPDHASYNFPNFPPPFPLIRIAVNPSLGETDDLESDCYKEGAEGEQIDEVRSESVACERGRLLRIESENLLRVFQEGGIPLCRLSCWRWLPWCEMWTTRCRRLRGRAFRRE